MGQLIYYKNLLCDIAVGYDVRNDSNNGTNRWPNANCNKGSLCVLPIFGNRKAYAGVIV